jgi:3-hydroxybutyrate dehydrogenase
LSRVQAQASHLLCSCLISSKKSTPGINLEFARLLLKGGCNVLVADLGLRTEAQELLEEFSNTPKAVFQKTDVTSWKDLDAMMKAAEDNFGQIDIVCPGAGVFEPPWSNFWHPPGSAESKDSPDGNRYSMLDINLIHPIRLTQLAIPYFLKNGASPSNPKTIVHIASIAGEMASLPVPMYHASKWAIHGFVRSLGDLEAKYGIRVAAVLPGVVKTPLWTDHPEKVKAFNEDKDVWVTPQEVSLVMLAIVEKDKISTTLSGQADPDYHTDEIKIVGGSCLEVSAGKVRDVPMHNNSGPFNITGNHISNVAALYDDTFELIKPGSSKA